MVTCRIPDILDSDCESIYSEEYLKKEIELRSLVNAIYKKVTGVENDSFRLESYCHYQINRMDIHIEYRSELKFKIEVHCLYSYKPEYEVKEFDNNDFLKAKESLIYELGINDLESKFVDWGKVEKEILSKWGIRTWSEFRKAMEANHIRREALNMLAFDKRIREAKEGHYIRKGNTFMRDFCIDGKDIDDVLKKFEQILFDLYKHHLTIEKKLKEK